MTAGCHAGLDPASTGAGPRWIAGQARNVERCFSSSNDTISPAMALAATVGGLASHTWPGPERPGKLRLIALTVTCKGLVEDPGPQLAQAPQEGWSISAPMAAKVRS